MNYNILFNLVVSFILGILKVNKFKKEGDNMTNSDRVPNHLINEKSPYLLQHAYNPINWYPWCKEAFNRAGKEEKPIFLSIGYS